MSDKSKIQWTDATWNPVTGCTKVSSGCTNCYAETFSERFRGTPGHYFENGFDVQLRPAKLDQPLRWRKPRRIFINSMSDLFHEDVPDEFIDRVFAVMALARRHTFQLLTKRPQRMREYLSSAEDRIVETIAFEADPLLAHLEATEMGGNWQGPQIGDEGRVELRGYFEDIEMPWPLPNVMLGVSVEDQRSADERIPLLLDTPAAVRFLSCEPLLGRVQLGVGGEFFDYGCGRDAQGNPRIDWVICGGESGPKARPCDVAWMRSIVGQCKRSDVPVFVKQLGSNPRTQCLGCTCVGDEMFSCVHARLRLGDRKGGDTAHWPPDLCVREFPEVAAR